MAMKEKNEKDAKNFAEEMKVCLNFKFRNHLIMRLDFILILDIAKHSFDART